MSVLENGKLKHSWRVSTGKRGYASPVGTYKPKFLKKMHYSRKYDNAPMPHSIFFHGGYAIHATGATWKLGQPASHGCIRLSPGHARTLFSLVQKHGKAATRIRIAGRENFGPSRSRYARNKSRRSRRVASRRTRTYNSWGQSRYVTVRKRKRKNYSSSYWSWNYSAKPRQRSHRVRYTYYRKGRTRVVYYRNGRQYVTYR